MRLTFRSLEGLNPASLSFTAKRVLKFMSGKSNLIIVAIVAVVLAVVGIAYITVIGGGGESQTQGVADISNPEQVALGAAVYAKSCADCHGANLEGKPNWRVKNADGTLKPPPHDATGHTWHHPDNLLFKITKDGGQDGAPAGFTSAMPGFGKNLSDEEIWAVVAYIKSRWPEKIQKRQEIVNKRSP